MINEKPPKAPLYPSDPKPTIEVPNGDLSFYKGITRKSEIGNVNQYGQSVIAVTGLFSTDSRDKIYILQCGPCGATYCTKSSEYFERKCPTCQGS